MKRKWIRVDSTERERTRGAKSDRKRAEDLRREGDTEGRWEGKRARGRMKE